MWGYLRGRRESESEISKFSSALEYVCKKKVKDKNNSAARLVGGERLRCAHIVRYMRDLTHLHARAMCSDRYCIGLAGRGGIFDALHLLHAANYAVEGSVTFESHTVLIIESSSVLNKSWVRKGGREEFS